MSICSTQTEAVRASNRAEFPETSRIVDKFRAEFGPGVKLVYAEENGKTIGKKPEPATNLMTLAQWFKINDLIARDAALRELSNTKIISKRGSR